MLKKVSSQEEIRAITDYIGDDYKATPYLYVNVIKYGLGTDNVFTWIDQGDSDQIEGVYLLYYDCIHFYTKDIESYPIERLVDFINNTEHRVIMLQGDIGTRIQDHLSDYYNERNHIIDMDKVNDDSRVYESEIATRDDISAIVDLLMEDPEYVDVYDRDVLSRQMFDRYDSGFSRYFVVRRDGKVVSTCSTYGEVPGFALVGGVMVHRDYRRQGLASEVEMFACHTLASEGISKVGFVNFNNSPSLALHEKLGAFSIATLAKFVKQ